MLSHTKPTFIINGYLLYMTCSACPEQYDVYLNKEQVAYLRLRHGTFRATCPDFGGEEVYCVQPNGDGIFEDDEREYELTQAIKAICSYQFKLFAEKEYE